MRSTGRLLALLLRLPSSLGLAVGVPTIVAALTIATSTSLSAQEPAAAAAPDFITPHITDSYNIEIPWFNAEFAKEICLGRHDANGECGPLWDAVHIGRLEINFSPTKHVVFL